MDAKYISKSKKLEDGVCVWFGNSRDDESYYAHGIQEIGEKSDDPGNWTMWSWINHMRGKRWWNEALEDEFITEVKKYL